MTIMDKFMKKIICFSLALTAAVTVTSCEKNADDSDKDTDGNVIISPIETTSVTDTEITTAANTEYASENSAFYYTPPVELPDGVSENKENVKADGFVYTDYLGSEYDSLALIALDDKYAYFEKWICNFTNCPDLSFYKYDLTTGESTEFNGIVPGCNVKTGDTAFVDGRIYSVMYGSGGRIHYLLDTLTNSAEIIQKGEGNDSLMRTTHAIGKDSYMEIWATGQGYNETIHVMLFNKSGSKEIITKKYNSSKERLVYTANGDHIYEYSQTSDSTEPCLNIYNENGELESSVCLKEIAYELKQDPDNYVAQMNVSGRFISFDFNFGESTAKSYIYDMEIGSYYRADCCQSIATPNYLPPDFGKILFLQRNSDSEGTKFDLFCLYANGGIEKLSENIGIDTMIVANGEKAAYFKNKELYTIEY